MNGKDFILFYEKYAAYKLAEYMGINSKDITHLTAQLQNSPYDLEYKGVKYDVKISSPVMVNKANTQAIWDFNLRKGETWRPQNLEADYFILIGMKNAIPNKVFLISSEDSPGTHIRISINGYSKYHKYEI